MSTLSLIEEEEHKTMDKENQTPVVHTQRDEREQQFMKTYEALRKYASQHFSCDG